MADSALVKINAALAALFASGMTGVNVFYDRSEDDPVRDEERPCLVFRVTDVQFDETPGRGEMRHVCTLDIDIYEDTTTAGALSTRLANRVSDLNSVITSDRTLGGRLESFELRSATASIDEAPDLGAAIVSAEVTFITPRTDFTTIQGASGTF